MKILHVDMDNVLVDFGAAIANLPEDVVRYYDHPLDEVPGSFSLMEPVPALLPALPSTIRLVEWRRRFSTLAT